MKWRTQTGTRTQIRDNPSVKKDLVRSSFRRRKGRAFFIATLVLFVFAAIVFGYFEATSEGNGIFSGLFNTSNNNKPVDSQIFQELNGGDGSIVLDTDIRINGLVEALGGITTEGADIDAGSGNVFASNLIYAIIAGAGLSASGGQTPTITNTDLGSAQAIFKTISVGSDNITAESNTDTLTLKAGDLINLSTSGKEITIGTSADNYASWSFAVDGTTQDGITAGDVLDFVHGTSVAITRSDDDKLTFGLDTTEGLTVGSAGQFVIDSSGNITKLNDVAYSFPSAQGAASSVLMNDGVGALSWGTFGAASVTADSLDFAQFVDAMTVDADTSINLYNSGDRDLRFYNSNSSSDLLYLDGSTGRVGIGTTSPGYKLDVSGNLNLSSGSTFKITGTDVLSSTTLGSGVVTSSLTTVGALNAGSIASGFGSIDVGTDTITTSGAISGGTLTDGTTTFADTTWTSTSAIAWDLANAQAKALNVENGLLTLDTQNSRVGIGTTSPDSKLHLVGGDLYVAPDSGYTFNNPSASEDLYVAGNLEVDGTLYQSGNGVLDGSGGIANYLAKFSDSNTLTTGLVYDNGTNVGIGTTAPGAKLDVAGTTWLRGVAGGTSGLFVNSSGNVGIGTTSPGANLEISGPVPELRLTTPTAADSGFLSFYSNGSRKGYIQYNNSTGQLNFSATGSANGFNFVGGNVGIGNISPSAKLHVQTDSSNTTPINISNPVAVFSNFDTTAGNYASLEFRSKNTGGTENAGATISGIFSARDSSHVQSELGFYTRNISGTVNEGMRIDETGNVGIGTSNPLSLLSVGASSQFQVNSSGTALLPDGSAASPALTFTGDTNTGLYRLGADKIGLITGGGSSNGLTIDASGNVGIGTTAPIAKTQIALNAGTAVEALRLQSNTNSAEGNSVRLAFTSQVALDGVQRVNASIDALTTNVAGTHNGQLAFYTMNNLSLGERMRISNTGAVGIGTINPAYTLDVAGTIRASRNAGTAVEALRLQSNTNSAEGNSVRLAFTSQVALDSTERVNASIDALTTNVAGSHYGQLAFY